MFKFLTTHYHNIHPSPKGYKMIFLALYHTLQEHIFTVAINHGTI